MLFYYSPVLAMCPKQGSECSAETHLLIDRYTLDSFNPPRLHFPIHPSTSRHVVICLFVVEYIEEQVTGFRLFSQTSLKWYTKVEVDRNGRIGSEQNGWKKKNFGYKYGGRATWRPLIVLGKVKRQQKRIQTCCINLNI